MKTIPSALLAILTLGFAALIAGAAQESSSKQPVLKSISCPPECGFMARSHDEKELIEIVKAHAREKHGKDVTDAQLKDMVKVEKAKKG